MTDWILQRLGSTPGILAIDFETAVFIVVVVVSLLGRLFGRKQDPDHGQEWFDDDEDWSQQQKKKESGAMDWEDQMRRLLEGESPEEQPQPRQQTPIVPPPVSQSEAPPPIPIAQPVAAPSPTARLVSADDLKSSHAALAAAKKKHAEAQAKLQGVAARRSRRKPQAHNAIRLLRSAETAQQAIIASVILGKPRGID